MTLMLFNDVKKLSRFDLDVWVQFNKSWSNCDIWNAMLFVYFIKFGAVNSVCDKQLNFYHNVFVQLREMHGGCMHYCTCDLNIPNEKIVDCAIRYGNGWNNNINQMNSSFILNRADWYKCVSFELKFQHVQWTTEPNPKDQFCYNSHCVSVWINREAVLLAYTQSTRPTKWFFILCQLV